MNILVVEKEFWTSFANHFDYDNSKTVSLLELHAMLEAIESSASEDETQQFVRFSFDFICTYLLSIF